MLPCPVTRTHTTSQVFAESSIFYTTIGIEGIDRVPTPMNISLLLHE